MADLYEQWIEKIEGRKAFFYTDDEGRVRFAGGPGSGGGGSAGGGESIGDKIKRSLESILKKQDERVMIDWYHHSAGNTDELYASLPFKKSATTGINISSDGEISFGGFLLPSDSAKLAITRGKRQLKAAGFSTPIVNELYNSLSGK